MLRILITSGGTREPIDDVRFISNVSSGATGAALANALADRGHAVTLLRGQGSVAPRANCRSEIFSSAADLLERIQQNLRETAFDGVIMCAAVADYRPDAFISGKIRSDADELVLRLIRNPKILPRIKTFSNPSPIVIGFKLTVGATADAQAVAVSAQFKAGGVDAVVQNDLAEIHRCPVHPFNFYRNPRSFEHLHGTSALATMLAAYIEVNGPAR